MNKHQIIKNPLFKALRRVLWNNEIARKISKGLSDKTYYFLCYWWGTLKILNLNKPETFTEKIVWLNMNNDNFLYTICSDKYLVRNFVKDKLGKQGEEILPILYGAYESTDAIDIKKLPSSFVIKANHGSGWNLIVKDKSKINWKKEKKMISKWLDKNYFDYGRQKQYKDIKPVIICEEFLQNSDGTDILDYKFMCFNGEPTMIWIDYNRYTKHVRNFYSLDGTPLYYESDVPTDYSIPFIKPPNYKKMIEISKLLSTNFPHVRVDLYNIDGRILLGEMTFTSWGGYVSFGTPELDELWGNHLKLNLSSNERL